MGAVGRIPANAPPLVPAAELARWAGVGSSTVQHWIRAGVLPAPQRIGPKLVFFTLDQVRQFFARRFGGNAKGSRARGKQPSVRKRPKCSGDRVEGQEGRN